MLARTSAISLAVLALAFAPDAPCQAPKGLQVPGGAIEATPAGPESMVEVLADKPIEFTYEPILVGGRLSVLDDDVVYYRLSNAKALQP